MSSEALSTSTVSSNEHHNKTTSNSKLLSLFYKGFRSRFVWKDGVVGSQAVCTEHLEESISWINFFLDLLYVAVIANITVILTSCELSTRTIAVVYAVSIALFKFRWGIDEYSIRFYQDDLFHRTLFFIYIMGIYFMGSDISYMYNPGTIVSAAHRFLASETSGQEYCHIDQQYYTKFAVGFIMSNISITIIYSVAFFQDASRKVIDQYFYRTVLIFISTIIMIVSTLDLSEGAQISLLVLASEIELAVPIIIVFCRKYLNYTGSLGKIHYPVNYMISQERLGIYILLYLGEGVIKAMQMTLSKGDYTYIYSVANMVLIFLLGVQFFDRVQGKEGQIHACRRHMFWGLVYLQVGHRFLAFALLFVIAGMTDHSASGGLQLSVGCGFSTLIMICMRMLHKGIGHKFSTPRKMLYLLVELLVCVCHFLVILADHQHISHGDRVVIHAAITLVYVIWDTFGIVSEGLLSNASSKGPPAQLHLVHTESQSADKPIDIEVGHYSDLSGNQEEVGRISLN